MVKFSDRLPSGLPKLPENYWELLHNEKTEKLPAYVFDNAVKSSLIDITHEISIFKKREP